MVFNQDPWRIRQLKLLALADAGDTDVLDDPGRVISMANEYAATGIGILIDQMTGQTEPIWAVTSLFRSMVEEELRGARADESRTFMRSFCLSTSSHISPRRRSRSRCHLAGSLGGRVGPRDWKRA